MHGSEAKEKAFGELMLELNKDKTLHRKLMKVVVCYYNLSMNMASQEQIDGTFYQFKGRLIRLKRDNPRAFIHSEAGSGVVGKGLTKALSSVQQAGSSRDRTLAVDEIMHLVHSTGTLLAYLFDGVKGTKIDGLMMNMLNELALGGGKHNVWLS